MRMMELINCICNVIGAIYPILKDALISKKKKAACDVEDHKRKASQEQG